MLAKMYIIDSRIAFFEQFAKRFVKRLIIGDDFIVGQ